GRERETLLCYSMVNTLCENTGARKVCFFFEGEQVESIAGLIYWAGVFDVNNGLCEASYG
ncbi:MAG: GerMN domain-containing protein, partial [Clostridia bacterium]|nr:GerMN domain-containing protein [Clostridia bacterium]